MRGVSDIKKSRLPQDSVAELHKRRPHSAALRGPVGNHKLHFNGSNRPFKAPRRFASHDGKASAEVSDPKVTLTSVDETRDVRHCAETLRVG